jgi:hypothetical protein
MDGVVVLPCRRIVGEVLLRLPLRRMRSRRIRLSGIDASTVSSSERPTASGSVAKVRRVTSMAM